MDHYKLLEKKTINELNAVGEVYIHEKSGAKLFFVLNDDDNKAFSISFRTPPQDHTGLPHILEHSVLCGSKKFPIKDPFVELAKGSLNTFLNAMTFSDKTMYPIASCNDKDFENLMNVYLDAVFYPNMLKEEKILAQEGWHYELKEAEDELSYRGVVYNEMKGVFSSPEQILFRKIQQSLFPDNPYQYESGGDPEFIPDLTQEAFVDFHQKYYHPSNSYIFLYGKLDVEEKLNWLHLNYLKDFDAIKIDSGINTQKPFEKQKEITEFYPISSNESVEDKTYLSLNFVTGLSVDPEAYTGLEILEYMLLEAPGAPLKKALLDAGIGKDVFGSFDSGILQPTFSIIAKNTNEDQKDAFIEIINRTLKQLLEEGLDQKKLLAAINYFEFRIKEADFGRYPKGVIYAMKVMDSWLYDGSPFLHLEYNSVFEAFKEGVQNKYFENLLEKYLLNNQHSTILFLKPDQDLLVNKEEELQSKLKEQKERLSPEEIQDLIEKTKELERFQSMKEKKEDLETIPLLEISDIKKENEMIWVEEKTINNIQWLRHEAFTNNIVYLELAFDTKKVPEEFIPYIGLLTQLFGRMNTENYEYSDLASEINIHTGGIRIDSNVFGVSDEADVFRPKTEIAGKCFSHQVPKLLEITYEILFRTVFDEKVRLKEIIAETKSRMEMGITGNGHLTAANRAESYFSKAAEYRERISGVSYYEFIEELEKNFDERVDQVIENLKGILHFIFRPENLIVASTCEKGALSIVEEEIKKFADQLDHTNDILEDTTLTLEQKNEGFMTSGKVQYVAKAGNYIQSGYKYSGYLRVLQTILSLDYLWHHVRVKGGAYGCMASFKRNGSLYFVSYRDPNLNETIDVYDRMFSYISTFSGDDREIRKYIIGTISKLDQPLTPSMKNERILALLFSNISNEDLQRERDEVLSTTAEDIRALAPLVKETLKQGNICVLGNEKKVENAKELFKETKHLFS